MNESLVVEVGLLRLNGETYKIVRPDVAQVAYEREYVNSPPWQEGEPAEAMIDGFTWHLGGFKSRAGAVGTSEYGENTDGSWPLRLLPGPKVNEVILNDALTFEVNHLFSNTTHLFVCAGRYVFRVDAAFTVVLSRDFGAGVNVIMGLVGLDGNVYVTTDAATNSLWRLTTWIAGGPDVWTQSNVTAYRIVTGINRTFKITQAGVLSNIRHGLDLMVAANWGDTVQIGDATFPCQSLVSYERTVLVGKQDGLYSVGEEGFGVPEIRRMATAANNTHEMRVFDPYLMVPHARGLFRWQPGEATPVGIEEETLNQSPVRGPIVAMVTDGKWLYTWMQNGTRVWLNRGRERRRGESGISPIIWDTWVMQDWNSTPAITGNCLASHFTAGSPQTGIPSRIYWGVGKRLYYITLGSGGGVSDTIDPLYRFNTNASSWRFTAKMNFDDRNPKDFRRIVLEVTNVQVAPGKYVGVMYSIDGGLYQAQDIGGFGMQAKVNGINEFFLGPNAIGREIQLGFYFTNNSETSPPELRYWAVYAVPQSKKVARTTVHLLLQENYQTEVGYEMRSALQQQQALEALLVSPSPVNSTGPWGDEVVTVKEFSIINTLQDGQGPHSFITKLTLQERASV